MVVILTVGIALLIGGIPPLATGEPTDRALDLSFSVLLLGTALSIFMFRFELQDFAAPRLRPLAIVALAVVLLASPHIQLAATALRTPRAAWRLKMISRLTTSVPDVVMTPLEAPSRLVNVPGVWSADIHSWLNGCVARFMGPIRCASGGMHKRSVR